ncbi:Peptidase M20 domain-containing protein 2 [Psilocybe cubensis]|uniref:Peptidase M20 dimerisation domain-containing protein n=2 Tax=Psilocybe cubensis TaxID=181762 RepID=A0A8H7XRE5_PSICU|nr:Peptidase M20 domain-containing protein 2 [Psilocybe cubensis]KAH9479424.1 Peptidase M20 domain-containing protein 2 [Psilocybe cubensis]
MSDLDAQPGCFAHFFSRKTRFGKLTTRTETKSTLQDKPLSEQEKVYGEADKRLSDSETLGKTDNHCYFTPNCVFSYGSEDEWWNVAEQLPSYSSISNSLAHIPGSATSVIDKTLNQKNESLRALSMKIHGHPETMFTENYAHDLLTAYMEKCGFKVTRHYLGLNTAWKAEYSQGTGGRVIGINSEMDALPGIGHACGHNLIAISGVGVAIALKAALEAQPQTSAKQSKAEEGGGGKVILLERGAYEEMDACIMCHPSTGLPHSASVGSSTAMQSIQVEYFGHAAHAGGAPWEGTNALDAAFIAYSGISMLRQQMKPDHRVHGVVEGRNWLPNVIPDYAKMRWLARAPTSDELSSFTKRVQNCLEAAALATGCRVDIKLDNAYFDLHQNPVLAQGFADIAGSQYGIVTTTKSTSASTDFGNVSYGNIKFLVIQTQKFPAYIVIYLQLSLPYTRLSVGVAISSSLPLLLVLMKHAAIPTEPNGGNHTAAFAKAAGTEAAHTATIAITKSLALTGYRVLTDTTFFNRVQASFERSKTVLA